MKIVVKIQIKMLNHYKRWAFRNLYTLKKLLFYNVCKICSWFEYTESVGAICRVIFYLRLWTYKSLSSMNCSVFMAHSKRLVPYGNDKCRTRSNSGPMCPVCDLFWAKSWNLKCWHAGKLFQCFPLVSNRDSATAFFFKLN